MVNHITLLIIIKHLLKLKSHKSMNNEDKEIKDCFIGIIDGKKCTNIKSFLFEIGKAFNFPDYYGVNMNAMLECLNDLSWIEEKDYALKIENFGFFLSEESIDDKKNILKILKNVANEWGEVPNYEGEEEFRKKANFFIYTT
jgi:RNAse (barnase) inhibitor barstar